MPSKGNADHLPDLTYPPGEETPRPAGGRWLPWVLVGVLAAVLTLVLAWPHLSGWFHNDTTGALTTVQQTCDSRSAGTRVEDGGNTLIVDTLGAGDTYGVDDGTVSCICDAVGMPEGVQSHMLQTRREHGSQQASWDGYEATWTADVYEGLNLVVTRT